MTRQVTDNLYIDLEYFTPEEYYTYEAEAEIVLGSEASFECVVFTSATVSFEAALTSEFSTSTQAQRVAGLSIDLVSEFTQTATISHIEGADLFAFTEANLAAAVSRIRDNNIEVTAVFDVGVDAVRIQQSDALVSSDFTVSAQAQRSKSLSSSMNAAFSFTAQAQRVSRNIGPVTVNSGTTFSTVVIDTANKKFGAGSLRFNQKFAADNTLKGHVSYPDNDRFDTWKTIDFWVYLGSREAGQTSIIPILRKAAYNQNNAEAAWLVNAIGASDNKYYISVVGWDTSGNSVSLAGNNTEGVFNANTWSHVRIVNSASASSLYINGVRLTNTAATGKNLPDTFRSNTAPLLVGGGDLNQTGTSTVFAQYSLDEILITDELLNDPSASTITVPTAPFVNGTLIDALLHYDTNFEDDAATTLRLSGAVNLSSAFTTTVNTQQFIGTSAALSSAATLTAQVSTVIEGQINIAAMASQLTAAIKNVNELADLTSSFALTAQVEKIKFAQADLTSEFTLTAEALDLDLVSADITSEFALNTQAQRIRTTSVNAACTASFTAQGDVVFPSWRTDHWIRGVREGTLGTGEPNQHIQNRGVAVDEDGYIYELVDRWTERTGDDYLTLILIKRNPNGSIVWKKSNLLTSTSIGNSIEHAKLSYYNGHLYVSANFYSNAWSGYVAKINTDGVVQWGQGNIFRPVDHYVDDSGFYYIGGISTTQIAKLNLTTGNPVWGTDYTRTPGYITGADGDIYVSTDVSTLRINANTGAEIWRKSITGRINVNIDNELVVFTQGGVTLLDPSGSARRFEFDPSLGSDDLPSEEPRRRIIIDEVTGDYYRVSSGGVTAHDSELNVKWSRSFSTEVGSINAANFSAAVDDRYVYFGGRGFDLDLGRNPSYLVKLLKEPGDYVYEDIPLPAPFAPDDFDSGSGGGLPPGETVSNTFSLTAPASLSERQEEQIVTVSDTSIGTYTSNFPSMSPYNSQWGDETSTVEYNWIITVNGVSAVSSAFAVTALPTYIRQLSAALASEFNTSITANKISRGNLAAQVTSQVSTVGGRIRYVDSSLTSTVNVGVINVRSRDNSAAVVVESSMVTAADRIRNLNADIASEFTLSAEPLRIKTSAVEFASIATNLTAAIKVGQALVTLETVSTLSAQAEYTARPVIELASAATVEAESIVTVQGHADVSSEFTVVLDVDKIKPTGAELVTEFAANVSAIKTTDIVDNLAAEFNFAVAEQRFRGFDSAISSESAVDVTALKARTLEATVNSKFEVFASVFNIVQGGANLQSQGFVLTAGRVLNLDPYLTYIIPEETRYYVVTEESREFKINQETRTLIL